MIFTDFYHIKEPHPKYKGFRYGVYGLTACGAIILINHVYGETTAEDLVYLHKYDYLGIR
jgi:hypothetical protein